MSGVPTCTPCALRRMVGLLSVESAMAEAHEQIEHAEHIEHAAGSNKKSCRTAALGGHVARCQDCTHMVIAYNSCRNRHCPKCQSAAAKEWLAAREADLLPVGYFHLVFTLPAAIANIAYQNKAVIYDILFTASAETMVTVAADPKHLGARIGITSVLHTWGSALTQNPHSRYRALSSP
jgi:predicted Zn-ribbon and HTH transcriptional regulator